MSSDIFSIDSLSPADPKNLKCGDGTATDGTALFPLRVVLLPRTSHSVPIHLLCSIWFTTLALVPRGSSFLVRKLGNAPI